MSISNLTFPYAQLYVVSTDDIDAIKLRSKESAPLTHEDLDDNFANLTNKINEILGSVLLPDNQINASYGNTTPLASESVIGLFNAPSTEAANNHATLQFNLNAGTLNHVASISLVSESATLRRGALTFCTDNGTTRPEVMRIDSSGKVGIGTSTPTNKLSVNGNASAHAYEFYQNTSSSASEAIHKPDTGEIAFRTNSQERLRIDDSGNVGIGTTNPEASLDIVNTSTNTSESFGLSVKGGGNSAGQGFSFRALGLNGSTDFFVRGDGNVGIGTENPDRLLEIHGTQHAGNLTALKLTNDMANDNGEGVSIEFGGFSDIIMGRIESRMKSTSANSDLIFSTNPGTNNTSLSERMRILANGNVGIGIDNPDHKLQIQNSDGSAGADFVVSWIDGSTKRSSAVLGGEAPSGKGFLQLYNADGTAGTRLRTDGEASYITGGNFGVRTSNPTYDLDVAGDINFTGTLYQNGVAFSGGGGSSPWTTSGTNLYYNSGNVGIGTNSPAYKLSVVGDLAVGDNTQTGGVIDGVVISSTSTSSYNNTITHTDLGLEFGNTAVANRNFSFNGGNVGIGTSSPAQLLHVNSSPDASSARIRVQNSEGYAEIGTDGTDGFLTADGAEVLRFDSNGNVGIGTTSPDHKLHIAGGTPAMKLEGTQPRIWLSENDQTDLNTLIRSAEGEFRIDTASDQDSFVANRLTINHTSGNVGIGTTSPAFDLDVNGDAFFTGDVNTTAGQLAPMGAGSGNLHFSAGDGLVGTWGLGNNNYIFHYTKSGNIITLNFNVMPQVASFKINVGGYVAFSNLPFAPLSNPSDPTKYVGTWSVDHVNFAKPKVATIQDGKLYLWTGPTESSVAAMTDKFVGSITYNI